MINYLHVINDKSLISSPHVPGFMGWSRREASATAVDGPDARESDDDGFFEQSSLGDSDASRVDDTAITTIAVSLFFYTS